MYLLALVQELRKHDPDKHVALGFHNPHSHRANYYDLAFEPIENTTVGAMLAAAEDAEGRTFQGYKGGDFTMGSYTDVFLAWEGSCGEEISVFTLAYMLGGKVTMEMLQEIR